MAHVFGCRGAGIHAAVAPGIVFFGHDHVQRAFFGEQADGLAIVDALLAAGAMLLAVTLGRSLALATVTRIRASGFEMVWGTTRRVTKATRGEEVVLEAELRNRGFDDARGVNLRPVGSSMLDIEVFPKTLDLPAASKVRFELRVRPKRAGRCRMRARASPRWMRGRPKPSANR